MGVFDFIKKLFGGDDYDRGLPREQKQRRFGDAVRETKAPPRDATGRRKRPPAAGPAKGPGGWTVDELGRRVGMSAGELQSVPVRYREFSIPKRSGGRRILHAPDDALKTVQRRLLRRVLGKLEAHSAAHAYERDRSIVTNAAAHAHSRVVLRMDVKDFFDSTKEDRVRAYFRGIGWDENAAKLLTELTTHRGGLPQGAPTSPRLCNLVNHLLDARLAGVARTFKAAYTRYADDITFSFGEDNRDAVASTIRMTKMILSECGYTLHQDKKLRVMRRHDRQQVTGLVVNEGVRLPRKTRRWLRAVEHRAGNGGEVTLSAAQLDGWRALRGMVEQRSA